ncbi:MAG: hypothetical protein H0X62_10775, partial [Bacteroidetes bacterium]|nr:hypothetical protein [Bacteroidota bacterium]
MKHRKLYIKLYAEGDNVNYYTIQFENEISETQKFFDNFEEEEYEKDIKTILAIMEKISESRAVERHFRMEGKIRDSAVALPGNLYSSNLRLYCLRISDKIVILGNGGLKKTKTYNEDEWLS